MGLQDRVLTHRSETTGAEGGLRVRRLLGEPRGPSYLVGVELDAHTESDGDCDREDDARDDDDLQTALRQFSETRQMVDPTT